MKKFAKKYAYCNAVNSSVSCCWSVWQRHTRGR